MASTVTSPNNQQVRFRGRAEKESMPNLSEAQRGAMAAAAEGKSKLGIPKKVGQEFMDSDKGGKLPKRASDDEDRAGKLHKRGLISDKALDAAKAKRKASADDEIEGAPESGGPQKGEKTSGEGTSATKKGLALDDD